MAASVKSLLPLVLLVGMLGLLTVSASAEDVKVTFLFDQRLNFTGELFVRGNSSPLENSVAATLTPGDIWALTVTVTKGVPYEYYLKVLPQGYRFECTCTPFHSTTLTVPEDYPLSIYPEIVTAMTVTWLPALALFARLLCDNLCRSKTEMMSPP